MTDAGARAACGFSKVELLQLCQCHAMTGERAFEGNGNLKKLWCFSVSYINNLRRLELDGLSDDLWHSSLAPVRAWRKSTSAILLWCRRLIPNTCFDEAALCRSFARSFSTESSNRSANSSHENFVLESRGTENGLHTAILRAVRAFFGPKALDHAVAVKKAAHAILGN